MSKPMVREHNTETNEIIDREMTDAEYTSYQEGQAAQIAIKSEVKAKEVQRQAILNRLGLTSEEAKILLGA